MRRATLAILLAVSACAAASMPKTVKHADRGVYLLLQDYTRDGEDMTAAGTAFVLPGSGNRLITTAHNVKDPKAPIQIRTEAGAHDVRLMKLGSDEAGEDIAVLLSEVDLNEISPFRWCKGRQAVGDPAWIVGHGAGLLSPLWILGYVASAAEGIWSTGGKGRFVTISSGSVLLGHSGSPVFSDDGCIMGMLKGGITLGGTVNVIVPADQIRRFVR